MSCRVSPQHWLLIVATVLLALSGSRAQITSPSKRNSVGNGAASRGKPLKFEPLVMAEVIDNKASGMGFESFGRGKVVLATTSFRASDGETLSLQHGRFRSADEARRYFDLRIEKCSKLLNRVKRLDKGGAPIGWRAEIETARENTAHTTAIMWTDGADFRMIFGLMSDALELEKKYSH